MKIIVFVTIMALLGAAQLAIIVTGWESRSSYTSQNDPSPGPTRWH